MASPLWFWWPNYTYVAPRELSLDQTKLPVILGSWGNTFSLAFSKKPPFIVFCLVRKGSGIYRYGDIWKFQP